jgi:hypothetical protein
MFRQSPFQTIQLCRLAGNNRRTLGHQFLPVTPTDLPIVGTQVDSGAFHYWVAKCDVTLRRGNMRRMILTPSTDPATAPAPDPLLIFIQQAQLALVYANPR